MKKYKAVVIDFKSVLYRVSVFAAGALLLAATVGFAAFGDVSPETIIENNILTGDTDVPDVYEGLKNIAYKTTELLLGFAPDEELRIIYAASPALAAVPDNILTTASDEEDYSTDGQIEDKVIVTEGIPEENRAPIKSIDAAQKPPPGADVAIGNETSYGINIDENLATPPQIDMNVQGPVILITHTHATESYASSGAEIYDLTASDRSDDKEKNVVAIGRRMKEVFDKKGIAAVHDEILHDKPSFNGSYAHSLKTVEEYKKKYPSIQIVFDIHRDSIVYSDKTKVKTVTEINNKRAAQLMFVVGTDENGLDNPNWRSNMKAAMNFQKVICDKYPRLMRHINLRRERFNGHTTGASMIIEVGTSGNSIDEALWSIELATECIADYLMSL